MAKRRNLIPTKPGTISENKKSFIEDVFLKTWHPYVWIASLGFLLYFQAIFFDFAYFDDDNLILGNSYFLSNLSNIFEAFNKDVFRWQPIESYYRPLLTISFMLDAQISGVSPWMYHLSNIIIHIIASSLLFVLLARLKYSKKLSLFVSLIFTVHPVLTQAVCWIPGRNDSLLAVFILASFIFLLSFIEKKKWCYYGLHILFSALALFTKELGFVIIAMSLVYLLIIAREKILSSNMMVLAFGWAMAITCWLLARCLAFHNPKTLTISDMLAAIWKDLPATFIFLGKILFPVNLSVLPILRDSTFIFGYLTLILLIIALVVTRKIRFNFVIFGALWFILFLIPTFSTSEITLIAYFMEPRIYLPLIGFIIILLETGLIKKMESKKGYLLPIGAIVVIGLSILTFSHSKVFRDGMRYWENAVATSSHYSPFVRHNLGMNFYREGMRLLTMAEQEYQQSLRDNPTAQRNLNSGYYLEAIRLINKAEAEFRKTAELHPTEKVLHNDLGVIYKLKRMYQEAETEFRKALEIDPAYDGASYNLGMVYADRYLDKKAEAKLLAEKGNLAESEKKLKEAGELLMEAEKYWGRRLQLTLDSIDGYKILLVFYLREMDFPKAFKYFVELKKRDLPISPSLERWATAYQTNPDSIDCYQILLEYFLAEGRHLDFAAQYARVLQQKGITLPDEIKKKLNLAR